MTSGMPRELHPELPRSGVVYDHAGMAGPFLDGVRGIELRTEPGTEEHYSNLGYWILGAVVESVTGETFADTLDELIWDPLALNATTFGRPSTDEPRLGQGHLRGPRGELHAVSDPNQARRYASGALYSTMDDLLTMCVALRDERLVSAEAARQMASGFIDTRRPPRPLDPMIVTTGAQPGLVTFFACGLDEPVTIILLSNQALDPPDRIGAIANEILKVMR
jgi:CubicO group peptidase (beta-lactamase class C family)